MKKWTCAFFGKSILKNIFFKRLIYDLYFYHKILKNNIIVLNATTCLGSSFFLLFKKWRLIVATLGFRCEASCFLLLAFWFLP